MSPGSPLVALPERFVYLAGMPAAWTLGWACWMLCTLLLVAFLALLPRRLGDAGRQLVVTRFSPSCRLAEHVDLYRC